MIEADVKALRAMMLLGTEERLKPFLSWLKESLLHESKIGYRQQNDVENRWAQGGCQKLEEVIKAIESAPTAMKAIEDNARRDRNAGGAY